MRTSQGVCSEECGEETGGGWVSLRRGCLIQRDPLVWRVLRPATSSPNCSFIPQTHEVLRHPWGAPAMQFSEILGVLPPVRPLPDFLPLVTRPTQRQLHSPRLTLPVFLLLHWASLLSWPCVLEPSLSHCLLLGSIHSPISHSSPTSSNVLLSLHNSISHRV